MACLFPWFRKEFPGTPIPCGRCPNCRKRDADGWIFRCLHQERESMLSSWIRLSYDNEHVPLTRNGFMTLCRRDTQLFFKRLRERHGSDWPAIKYFGVGEYGSKYERPHYHLLLLNCREDFLADCWIDTDRLKDGLPLGEVYIDPRPITEACIGYMCGYMSKPYVTGKFRRDDRVREFKMISKGIGRSYLSPKVIAFHNSTLLNNNVRLPGGQRIAIPRYYVDKLFRSGKAVNGFLCPVARVANQVYNDMRSDLWDSTFKLQSQRRLQSHIDLFGSDADFVRTVNAARMDAVAKFHKSARKRNDY